MTRFGEKCHCGHAMRSHNSYFYGVRIYCDCRYCGCLVYISKSSEKSEWEEVNRIKSELTNYSATEEKKE